MYNVARQHYIRFAGHVARMVESDPSGIVQHRAYKHFASAADVAERNVWCGSEVYSYTVGRAVDYAYTWGISWERWEYVPPEPGTTRPRSRMLEMLWQQVP
jgi:hypothetical protein